MKRAWSYILALVLLISVAAGACLGGLAEVAVSNGRDVGSGKAPSIWLDDDEDEAPHAISSGTREEILEAMGVFDTDELTHVSDVSFREKNNNQLMRVSFEDEVFLGGSEGYLQDWLGVSGAISEAYADLDNDGMEEYLVIYLVSSDETVDEDYTRFSNQWKMAIYENDEDKLNLACEFPVSFPWWDQRSISLIGEDDGVRILTAYSGCWDGGGSAVGATIYSYDGRYACADAVMYAAVGERSFLAAGPFDPADAFTLHADIIDSEKDAKKRYSLVEDENYWSFEITDWETDGYVYISDKGSSNVRLNRNAFNGFINVTEEALDYGIHAFFITWPENVNGRVEENYSLYIERGETILLWAKEAFDDNDDAYVDIVTHFEDAAVIESTNIQKSLPSPLKVIPEVPEDTGEGFAPLEAVTQPRKTPLPEDIHVRVTGDAINMRDKPSLNGNVVTSIPNGTILEYLEETSTDDRGVDWYKVSYKKREGWVSSKYTVLEEGDEPVSPTPTPKPTSRPSEDGKALITGDVNMRDKPSLNGNVVTSIPSGTTVDFLGKISTDDRGVDWYKIRYKGYEGWTSSKYTKLL